MRLLRNIFVQHRLKTAGERARDEHSRWLTQALYAPQSLAQPRIPTRRVDEGGFDRLAADPRGRRAISRFWNTNLDRPS